MSRAHYDAIIVADFRLPGGTSSAIASEIRALRQGNYTVGLCQMDSPILTSAQRWNERIVSLVEAAAASVLAGDAAATCGVLSVHNPWLFVDPQPVRRGIEATLRLMVAHHAPADARGRLYYDPATVDRYARRSFGAPFFWAPVSPVCRDAFAVAGMDQPQLRSDWTNVIFVDDWGGARDGLLGRRPIVGRHSRPQLDKWPATRADVLAAYPDGPDLEVRLLGVGEKVRALMAPMPKAWTVLEYNEVPVRDFLAGIDFFVYFHHPDWLESFGLTIGEAAAAGCVVITHPYLERTFADAALYCRPGQAPALVRAIAADPDRFAMLSARGRAAVAARFGPAAYVERFRRLLAAAGAAAGLEDLVVRPERCARLRLRSLAKRAVYWSRNGIFPGGQRLLRSKAVRRPARKIGKVLTSR